MARKWALYPGHVSGLGNWWDSVELWVTGLPFVPQVIVVMAVLVPLAGGVAWLLDNVLAGALRLLGRGEQEPVAETVQESKIVEVEN